MLFYTPIALYSILYHKNTKILDKIVCTNFGSDVYMYIQDYKNILKVFLYHSVLPIYHTAR